MEVWGQMRGDGSKPSYTLETNTRTLTLKIVSAASMLTRHLSPRRYHWTIGHHHLAACTEPDHEQRGRKGVYRREVRVAKLPAGGVFRQQQWPRRGGSGGTISCQVGSRIPLFLQYNLSYSRVYFPLGRFRGHSSQGDCRRRPVSHHHPRLVCYRVVQAATHERIYVVSKMGYDRGKEVNRESVFRRENGR